MRRPPRRGEAPRGRAPARSGPPPERSETPSPSTGRRRASPAADGPRPRERAPRREPARPTAAKGVTAPSSGQSPPTACRAIPASRSAGGPHGAKAQAHPAGSGLYECQQWLRTKAIAASLGLGPCRPWLPWGGCSPHASSPTSQAELEPKWPRSTSTSTSTVESQRTGLSLAPPLALSPGKRIGSLVEVCSGFDWGDDVLSFCQNRDHGEVGKISRGDRSRWEFAEAP